jgi:endo-1,4-beta-xylanase
MSLAPSRLLAACCAAALALAAGPSGAAEPGAPPAPAAYAGAEPDAAWRQAAAERIEKCRKADLTVAVQAADARPLAGAAVKVRLVRHAFGFGSAVAAMPLAIETEDARRYRDTVRRLFNKVVFENDLKWPQWEDTHNREWTIQALRWLEQQGIAVRGHCLVWPSWRYVPKDLQALKDRPEALGERVRQHLWDEVGALKGRIAEWDVVNEPYTNHDLMDALGTKEKTGEDVMAEWFQWAHQADPSAELYLNDYNILSAGGTDAAHQDAYEKTLRSLLEKGAKKEAEKGTEKEVGKEAEEGAGKEAEKGAGKEAQKGAEKEAEKEAEKRVPLGGIGLQGHFGRDLTPPERLLAILDRFAALGPPLQVTEFDVDIADERLQADYLRDFLTVCFSHPKVKGVLMWGFWEGRHWKPRAALFRKDWSVKPNGQAWMDLVLKAWWTEAQGKTDGAGRFRARGFVGRYEVTAEAEGKTKTVTVDLPAGGTIFTLALD